MGILNQENSSRLLCFIWAANHHHETGTSTHLCDNYYFVKEMTFSEA